MVVQFQAGAAVNTGDRVRLCKHLRLVFYHTPAVMPMVRRRDKTKTVIMRQTLYQTGYGALQLRRCLDCGLVGELAK